MNDLVTCTACTWLRGNWCKQARRAGISHNASIEIGTTLANLPQRCPAFKNRGNQ